MFVWSPSPESRRIAEEIPEAAFEQPVNPSPSSASGFVPLAAVSFEIEVIDRRSDGAVELFDRS